MNKGDGKVYLSDLNLKEINSAYLKKINEDEILSAIINVHGKRLIEYDTLLYRIPKPLNVDIAGTLKYINLSSMIWLNRKLIEKFLTRLLTKSRQIWISMVFVTPMSSLIVTSKNLAMTMRTRMTRSKSSVQSFTNRIWLLISLILECIRVYRGQRE